MSIHIKLTPSLLGKLHFAQQIDSSGSDAGATPKSTLEWSVRDEGVQGLLLRLTPTTSSWYVQRKMSGEPVKRKIGTWWSATPGYRCLTLDKARRRAKVWLGKMEQGIDPLVERRARARATQTERTIDSRKLSLVYQEYLSAKATKSKPTTKLFRAMVARYMRKAPIWKLPLRDIGVKEIEATFGPMIRYLLAKEAERNKPSHQTKSTNRANPVGQKRSGQNAGTQDNSELNILKPKWGPKSLSPSSLQQCFVNVAAAYTRAAEDEGLLEKKTNPFTRWRADQKWPAEVLRTKFLELDTPSGKAWLERLVAMHEQATGSGENAHELTKRARAGEADVIQTPRGVMIDLALVLLLLGTRIGETSQLRWETVDFDKKIVTFPASTTKNGKSVEVPLAPWALSILLARKQANLAWRPEEDSPWVFPSRKHNAYLPDARPLFRELKTATGNKISAHDLRRTVATEFNKQISQGLSRDPRSGEALAAAVMHHEAASRVTQRYVQILPEDLRCHYEQWEDRLRALLGLPSMRQNVKPDSAQKLRAIQNLLAQDPLLKRTLLASLSANADHRTARSAKAKRKNAMTAHKRRSSKDQKTTGARTRFAARAHSSVSVTKKAGRSHAALRPQ